MQIDEIVKIIISFFISSLIGYLISQKSIEKAKSYGEKTRQAQADELYREDDVLLQSIIFSQSVLFIYLNLIESSTFVNILKIIIPIFAITFYTIRSLGKILNNPKYRYYSIWLFAFIILLTLFAFFTLLILGILGIEMTQLVQIICLNIFTGLLIGSMSLIEEVFRKRYGYLRKNSRIRTT